MIGLLCFPVFSFPSSIIIITIIVTIIITIIVIKNGDELIETDELASYAEETGDFAQKKELASIVEALDSDGDGKIGLLDFVLFAARRKVIRTTLMVYDSVDR